jgi:hypothetical protein
MKRLLLASVISLCFAVGSVAGQIPERVPRGKVYIVFNEKGKVIARYKSGQRTNPRGAKKPEVDCFQIDCPSNWVKNAVCWRCVPRK